MSMDALQAARAYGAATRAVRTADETEGARGADFGAMVSSALSEASASIGAAETMTAQAAAGQAELVDVVTAVAAAEVTLETMISFRDQAIKAYQEIMRMPI